MSSDRHESAKGNILIVDDAPENIRLLSAMLQQAGYEIKAVEDGIAALEIVKNNLIDVVLLDINLDINMAGMNGSQVYDQLKVDLETHSIPVIFLIPLDNEADKLRGFEIGGADYITQPFQIPEVLARVKSQVAPRQLRQKLEEQNQLLQKEIIHRLAAEEALQKAYDELESSNKVDGLTLISNRRYFDEYLEGNWRQMQREISVLSLIICDIDLFHLYNETYGRKQGDECLQKVAQAIAKASKRPADLAARYGEEEFSIILPKTDASGAITVAKHIQRELQSLAIAHSQSPHNYLTLSIGVSTVEPTPQLEPQSLLDTAERALYQAKQEGRDRIIFKMVTPPEPLPSIIPIR